MGFVLGGVTLHDIIGAAHSVTGLQYQVVGVNPDNVLALLTPSSTVAPNTIPIGGAAAQVTWQGVQTWQSTSYSSSIVPRTAYTYNVGALANKYLQVHAAELVVETLVAQETAANIGGRVIIPPAATQLSRDAAAADLTIYVKHNSLTNGDTVYCEADGKVEFLAITSAAVLQAEGDYAYTVTRDLDGSGANDWYAGDAVVGTGQVGSGWLDLYANTGMKAASEIGPAIVGNVRTGAAYNAWVTGFALGNLNGLYGYGATTYGVALGRYLAGQPWLSVDALSGLRINSGVAGTVLANWDIAGNILVGQTGGGQSNVYISAGSLALRNNLVDSIVLDAAGTVTVGPVGAGLSNVLINAGEIRLRTNATTNLLLDTSGYLLVGELGAGLSNIYIEAGEIRFRTNLVNNAVFDTAGNILLGQVAAGQSNVYITSGEVLLRNNTAEYISLDAAGILTVGTVGLNLANVLISGGSIYLRSNVTNNIILDGATSTITVGQVGVGLSNVLISSGDVQIRNNTDVRVSLASDGSGYIGDSGITWDTAGDLDITGILTVGLAGGIYQGTGTFAVPTTGLKIWNDTGIGRWALYSGGTAQVYAATDGKLYTGGGRVWLDSSGISLTPGLTDPDSIKWVSGGTVIAKIYGQTSNLILDAGYAGSVAGIILLQAKAGGLGSTLASISLGATSPPDTGSVSLNVFTGGTFNVVLDQHGFYIDNSFWLQAVNNAGGGRVNILQVNAADAIALGAALTTPYQITSTLAVGTAPFAVTSTTKVANLNADLLDDLDTSTNPGAAAKILKTDAGGLLQLAGLGIGVAGAANWLLVGDGYGIGNGSATARLVFDSSGATDYAYLSGCNFGINTTIPRGLLDVVHGYGASAAVSNFFGATYPLTLAGHQDSGGRASIWHHAYAEYNGAGEATYKWVSTHGSFGSRGIRFSYGVGEGITFYADSVATTADTAFTPTERMRITNAGLVGIGVAPTATFQVNGYLAILDGVATPGTIAGYASLYVDTADGDLKVRFGDGTVKTIVVDT